MSAICNLVTVFCNWAKTDCISNDCSNLLPIAANWFDNSFTGDPQNKSSTYSNDFKSKYSKIEVCKESKRLIFIFHEQIERQWFSWFRKKSQLHINFTFCESSTCWAEAALASFKVFHSWRLRHVDSSWFILYIFPLDVVRHWKCNWIPSVTSRSSIFPCLKDSDLAHSRPHCQALGTSLADSTLEDSQRFQTLEILLGHLQPSLFFWSSSLFFTFFFLTWSRWT